MARNTHKKKEPHTKAKTSTKEQYDHTKIEPKWQKFWKKTKAFQALDTSKKPKFYGLIEFPYPSGDGLHVGHVRSNTAMDIIARKRRSEGYEVLYPIGWDAFGLPTENYAIKTGIHPSIVTKKNTDTFRRQLQAIGFSFDWDREIDTSNPKYYTWTQWIFLQMFKRGLAYQSETEVWWCEALGTVLANEEVIDGKSERGDHPCVRVPLSQWMLAITKYADRLHDDLDSVDYLEKIKIQQRNWIGRSEGSEITFRVKAAGLKIDDVKVFTTRPDTLFGVTYIVIAPEHSLITRLKEEGGSRLVKNWDEVESYVKTSRTKSNIDRSDTKEKTGVELKGVRAINPINGDEVPVWVAEYVIGGYGTGAVMAVPAHDSRDFDFAKKYNLPTKVVIEPFLVRTEGTDAIKKDVPFVERRAVVSIIKHWSEEKYLLSFYKKNNWKGFIIGGIENGESVSDAGAREIKEETGYRNPKFTRSVGVIHSQFYHEVKSVNRFAHFEIAYFELENEERSEMSPEETALHDVVWLSSEEVSKTLNREDMRIAWSLFQGSAYEGEGLLVNSSRFNGAHSENVRKQITESVGGTWVSRFKLRDWVFSRQRYWGEPFPIVWVEKAHYELIEKAKGAVSKLLPEIPVTKKVGEGVLYAVPIPEKFLPVTLPKVDSFAPSGDGKSALSKAHAWVSIWYNVKTGEAKSGKKSPKGSDWVEGKRETDTMPNWAGSSWYYLRYIDPKNTKELAGKAKLSRWLPVDWYNGGMEHTTLHLLYSRFWHKFLYDIKVVPTKEPYQKRTAHGLILGEGGAKMSKSLGNVVNPDTVIGTFGADTLRVYEMFMGPFDEPVAWSTDSIVGSRRFLERVWKLGEKAIDSDNTQNKTLETLVHKTIQKVSDDIESMRFNTAISAMMILLNEFEKTETLNKTWYEILLKLLSPFAPHITEELWSVMGNKSSIHEVEWPKADTSKMEESVLKVAVQVMGKVRTVIEVTPHAKEEEIIARAKGDSQMTKWLEGKEILKTIYVPLKIVNFIVKG